MDNWKVNDVGGVFADAEMPEYGGRTQIILRIPSPDVIPEVGPDGYKIGFHSMQGLTEGWISKGPINNWFDHDGDTSGPGTRYGQSDPCDDCEIIEIDDVTFKHVSEQHEHHKVIYKIINPEGCLFRIRESFQASIVENDLWYDPADPSGSFWRDEDTTAYRRLPEIVGQGWYKYSPNGCYHLNYNKGWYIQGLSLEFWAWCGVPNDWHLIDTIDFGDFPTDIINCDFEHGPTIMTGPDAADWLEGQKAAYTDDPDCQVHIQGEEYWDLVMEALNDHPCSFYAVGASKDNHVNHPGSIHRPWEIDILNYYGEMVFGMQAMPFAYLMAVDETPFYEDEYDPVNVQCDPPPTVETDGNWWDEICFGCSYLDTYLGAQPPHQGIRLRVFDDLGNWKRSRNLIDDFTGSWEVEHLRFFKDNQGALEEISFCGSPLVERDAGGNAILDIAAHVELDVLASPPDYLNVQVGNFTDTEYPPDCPTIVTMPIYKVIRGTALYTSMATFFGTAPDSCQDEFYTRAWNSIEYKGVPIFSPPLKAADYTKTSVDMDPDQWSRPAYLWVSHREKPEWFSVDGRKDSTNAYSCDHASLDVMVVYENLKGFYADGCSPEISEKTNYIPDIKHAGLASIIALEPISGKTCDIGVQAEADLMFLNCHFKLQYDPDSGQFFHPFHNISPNYPDYPGDCYTEFSQFKWSDFDGYLSDDCDWIATTGCESLNDHPEALGAATDLITSGYLLSIGGFHDTAIRNDIYAVISDYSSRINECDGSYDISLWLSTPQTDDCNVISWMEAFCAACKGLTQFDDYPEGIYGARYARAVDDLYGYDINYPLNDEEYSWGERPDDPNDIYIYFYYHSV